MGLFDKFKKNKKYSFISYIVSDLPKGLKDDEINGLSNLSKEELGCGLQGIFKRNEWLFI